MWAVTSTFHIGPVHLGIRSDTDDLQDALTRALQRYLVQDVQAPPNFSLRLSSGDGGAGSQKLKFLYRGHGCIIRSRSRARVVRGLLNYLDAFVAPPDGTLRVRSFALVKQGKAYLVPRMIEVWLDLLSSPLHKAGFQFVDVQNAAVDLATRELVVPELHLAIDTKALETVQRESGGREPPPIGPGRYPIEAWAYFGKDGDSAQSWLLTFFQSTLNAYEFGVPETLRALESLGDQGRVRDLGSPYKDDLAGRIAKLAAS